jgi:ankyrin repeat protein
MAAAREKHLKIVKFLIDNGADVNAKDWYGTTVLIPVAEWGNLEIVKYLIDNGADVNAKDRSGDTVLMLVAFWGDLEIVRLLIDKGADANAKDVVGETVLMLAAKGGNPEVVKFLVDQGLDVNAETNDGETALMRATDWDYQLYIENKHKRGGCCGEYEDGQVPAALGKHLEIVKYLIDKGADVNAKDKNGQTAVSLASEKNQTEIVQYLKAHGAK